jgi:hypothetical protein
MSIEVRPMPDFASPPAAENHCHVFEPAQKTLEPIGLAREFLHGMGDTPIVGVARVKLRGATDGILFYFPRTGSL